MSALEELIAQRDQAAVEAESIGEEVLAQANAGTLTQEIYNAADQKYRQVVRRLYKFALAVQTARAFEGITEVGNRVRN